VRNVTGVQMCALPISLRLLDHEIRARNVPIGPARCRMGLCSSPLYFWDTRNQLVPRPVLQAASAGTLDNRRRKLLVEESESNRIPKVSLSRLLPLPVESASRCQLPSMLHERPDGPHRAHRTQILVVQPFHVGVL